MNLLKVLLYLALIFLNGIIGESKCIEPTTVLPSLAGTKKVGVILPDGRKLNY